MHSARRLLPSVAALRALEAVDRLGSASAAARELSLTQGAVSRQLQALERQLALDLVDRAEKRLTLNEAARDYAAEVRQALAQIADATVRLQSGAITGGLHLAILPAFGMRWLMPRLPAFARLNPDITLNMSTRLVPFNFAGEAIDAAIHYGDANWPGTEALLLRHEQVVAVCAPEFLSQYRPQTAQDVLALPLLQIQTRPTAWADWAESQEADATTPIEGTVYDQFATIIQAALHGLGVALLPDYLIEQDLASGRLVALLGGPTETTGAYYLVWPHSKARNPALMRFRHWLAEQAEPEDPLPR